MISTENTRLLSLDVYRGAIMVLLMLESTGLYHNALQLTEGNFLYQFFTQFEHHPWHGLRFWDLIQPGFMFIAGTALALSLDKQFKAGVSWQAAFVKVLKRSGWLFFWGVLDYAVRPTGLSFELWDVLTQLSFTTLIAFLIFQLDWKIQLSVCAVLLLLTEVLYRFTNVPGFDQPFTDQHNFGNYVDWLLMRKINDGGWVAINCIPTAVHTIGGSIMGKMLLFDKPFRVKIQYMLVAALACFILGYGLDLTSTPIIKRIATTSFVLASGGWCLLGLAVAYWWIDVKKHQEGWKLFTIVGMNSIFIYLFFEIVGGRWFTAYASAIFNGLGELAQVPIGFMMVLTPLCIFGLEWGLCFFLYRKKIFFKL